MPVPSSSPRLVSLAQAKRSCLLTVLKVGILTKQPSTTVWSAMVLFHRFVRDLPHWHFAPSLLACCCLWTASKSTDHPLELLDVCNAYLMVCFKPVSPEDAWRLLPRLREVFSLHEQTLLRRLRFLVDCSPPHPFLLHAGRTLASSPPVVRTAWAVLNDMLASDVCIRYPPHVLACAALSVAGTLRNADPVASMSLNQKKWHLVMDVSEKQLNAAVADVMALYDGVNKPPKDENE